MAGGGETGGRGGPPSPEGFGGAGGGGEIGLSIGEYKYIIL
jgi:hypothetical protein